MKPEMVEVTVDLSCQLLKDSLGLKGDSASVKGDGDYDTLSRGGFFDDED